MKRDNEGKDRDERGEEHENLLDRLEDRIEKIGKAFSGRRDDDDEMEQHHERGRTGIRRTDGETLDININVNIDCCPERPGRGKNGKGKPSEGRPGQHKSAPSKPPVPLGSDPSASIPPLVGGLTQAGRTGGTWTGGRKDNYVPYLFMRANAGDTGTRPVVGAFWESPDIFIEPGLAPNAAPAVPATLGGVAQANADNTVYAHVWNLGLAPAHDVYVEFFWFNPTLGFNGAAAHTIGQTWVDLGARASGYAHAVVKCPNSWRASYINGGHECLVVRVSQSVADPLGTPEWDASLNRHIGQRNIHVMSAAEAAAKPTVGLEVGPLFGLPAAVQVHRTDPAAMPWLHLVTMDRVNTFANANGGGAVGLTAPTGVGAGIPNLGVVPDPQAAGLIANQQNVSGDDKQVGFHTTDAAPVAGEANVYRIHATQGGQIVGGYTVVIIG